MRPIRRFPACPWRRPRRPRRAAAALAVAGTVAPAADASWPGRNGEVAFSAYQVDDPTQPDLNGGIWRVRWPEGHAAPLTREAAGGSGPSWSPDGERLVYSRGTRDVVIVDADGAERTSFTPRGRASWASWSPDGTKLLIDTGGRIAEVSLDGSGERTLTSGRHVYHPEWSPDRRWILFYRAAVAGEELLLLDPRTGVVQEASPHLASFEAVQDADWSPDGRSIVFAGWRDLYANADLYSVDLRGAGRLRRLTSTPDVNEERPTYSPDGRDILFLSGYEVQGDALGWGYGPFVMPAKGGSATRILTPLNVYFDEPSWQPLPRARSQC